MCVYVFGYIVWGKNIFATRIYIYIFIFWGLCVRLDIDFPIFVLSIKLFIHCLLSC